METLPTEFAGLRLGKSAGSGFGSSPRLARIKILDANESVTVAGVTQQALTFVAPPSRGLPSQDLLLTVNNATRIFTIRYSQAVTPRVTGVSGDYPLVNGRLMLPSSSAAKLTLTGSGFTLSNGTQVFHAILNETSSGCGTNSFDLE